MKRAVLVGFQEPNRRSHSNAVDDQDAGSYSTPETAAPSRGEAEAARAGIGKGMTALFASVFLAFVLVAVVVLTVRYVI